MKASLQIKYTITVGGNYIYLMFDSLFLTLSFILTQMSSKILQEGGALCLSAVSHQGEFVPRGFVFNFCAFCT